MTEVLAISKLSVKSENNAFILNNININVDFGDCVVIMGHNGAGKTTLLKTINGLTKYSSGTIKVFNSEINKKTKSSTGYIPQLNYCDKNMPLSVKEVLSIGLSAKYGIFKKITDIEDKLIEQTAKDIGIFPLLNKPAGFLSGGEMQKLSIARVLLQDAKLILMDEPLANLDRKTQQDISEKIDFICTEKKAAILMVVHNLSQIPKSCNKIALMENGTIIKFAKKKEIFNFDFFKGLYNL